MKKMRRLSAVCLSGLLVFGQSVSVTQAAENGTEKEEVVYAMLSGDGALEGAYVVNSFSDHDITDYGNYTKVKNLTTTDEVQYENGMIRIQTEADKLYYQGDLDVEQTELPWNIDIQYFMDGEEYDVDEIAGKSGSLKLILSITRNPSCDSSFWEGYALQATMLLDSSICRNIQAEGATIANVGSDKQLSYIILPGEGDTLEVTADVEEFEMGEISINGTSLNLDIQLDTEELTDKLQEIKDAAVKLDDGAGELKDGTKPLEEGADDLEDGVKKLKNGITSLNTGIKDVETALNKLNDKSGDLTDGSAEVLKNLQKIKKTLNQVNMDVESLEELSRASTQIQTGIASLVTGLQTVNGSIESYYQALSQAGIDDVNAFIGKHEQAISVLSDYVAEKETLVQVERLLKADISYIQGSDTLISKIGEQLDEEKGELMRGALSLQNNYTEFDKNIQSLTDTLQTLVSNMTSLKTGVDKLVEGDVKLDSGIKEYTGGVKKILEGYKNLTKGSNDLVKGTSALYKGTNQLVKGAAKFCSGTEEMKEGTEEFREKTKHIDSDMQDKVDEKIEEMTGSEVETGSFVSGKNKKVDSVLFIMKTPKVRVPEVEKAAEEEKEGTSIWQKFLNLF